MSEVFGILLKSALVMLGCFSILFVFGAIFLLAYDIWRHGINNDR